MSVVGALLSVPVGPALRLGAAGPSLPSRWRTLFTAAQGLNQRAVHIEVFMWRATAPGRLLRTTPRRRSLTTSTETSLSPFLTKARVNPDPLIDRQPQGPTEERIVTSWARSPCLAHQSRADEGELL